MFRTLLMAALLLVGGVVARYVDQSAHQPAAAMTVDTPAPANSRTMEIKASNGGHFAVEARVDGRRIDFMVDTGASQITLRESDAARLGIHPSQRDYSVRISTANGEGRAALVQLVERFRSSNHIQSSIGWDMSARRRNPTDKFHGIARLGMVEVGNIVVRDIPALITPDNALAVNLLGMSFLSHVRWTHEHGKLTLEQ
jgi:aspartyl protease family protein